MTGGEAIRSVYGRMYRAMTERDTATLARVLTEDSVLVHMTGHRQPRREFLAEVADGTLRYFSVETDSLDVTVDGDSARMVGLSRVQAAVYGGARRTWRLRMDSRLRKTGGEWRICLSEVSTY